MVNVNNFRPRADELTFWFYGTRWETITRATFVDSCACLLRWQERCEDVPKELLNCAVMVTVGADRPDVAAKLSAYDRANVGAILEDPGAAHSNYSAHVLRLVKKADYMQRQVLRMVYPEHVDAVEQWERNFKG